MKIILSIIENFIEGLIAWKIFVPVFIELSKTEVGNWAYLGLLAFLFIIVINEYISYKKNKCAWLVSKILDTQSK